MAESTKSGAATRSRSTAKPAANRKSTSAKKPSSRRPAAARSGTSATRSPSPKRRSSSGSSKRSSASRSRSSSSSNGRSSGTPARTPSSASSNGNGFVGTVKDVAGKAKGPAVAVGAAAAGIAGGLALKSRTRRKSVLGVKMPRSIGKGLPDLDAKAIAKSVGHASKRFAKTSKNVSKDLERAGDQAERIGKILD